MNRIVRLLVPLFAALLVSAANKDKPIELATKVEPDWSSLTGAYLVDRIHVEMTVLPSGEPFGLFAPSGIPDPVVRALAQWRFKSTAGKAFKTNLTVPVRRKLDSALEYHQKPRWSASMEIREALKRSAELTPEKAAEMFATLPNGEEPGNFRTTLLAYYARRIPADPELAQKSRRDLLLWLIHNYPQAPILTSPYAMVNDSESRALLQQAWLDAVKQYPNDVMVTDGAITFLRIVDPGAALQILSGQRDRDKSANWLGNLYALAGLAVNALDAETGAAMATASPVLSGERVAASFRKALLESTDLRATLSALVTLTDAAHDLNDRHALPQGYAEYCQALLKHTRDLYPQTSETCDFPAALPKAAPEPFIDGGIVSASIIKKVQPRYPQKAKDERVQGVVKFNAIISEQGQIKHLELVEAPLVFYESTYEAVLQWEYRPTRINGKPVPVDTDIIVNYALSSR